MSKEPIVIKIGTSVLTDEEESASGDVISHYLKECKRLMRAGYAPLLVVSGAVRLGGSVLPEAEDKKVLASVGQARLIARWVKEAESGGLTAAQILCSRPDIARRELFSAFEKTLAALLEKSILMIINENDALTNGEPEAFGNNDILAAIAAVASRAQCLILLTDQKGFYTADPRVSRNAELVSEIGDVTRELFEYCSAGVSPHGMGGMIAKLKAARMATAGGVETIIASGLGNPSISDILSGMLPRTRFLAKRDRHNLTSRDRWILATRSSLRSAPVFGRHCSAVSASSAGAVIIDEGAAEALKRRKTLLAVGVRGIRGEFDAGSIIEIIRESRHEIGCSIVQISSRDLRDRLMRHDRKDIDVIHCDHLIIY